MARPQIRYFLPPYEHYCEDAWQRTGMIATP